MVIPGFPALGVRFDIDKVDSGAYGFECWKVFWGAVDPATLSGSLLYEGDTAATLDGRENVYVIAVQKGDLGVLQQVRANLEQSLQFFEIAASPAFVDEGELSDEPLPQTGRIEAGGELVGESWAKSALDAVRNPGQTG